MTMAPNGDILVGSEQGLRILNPITTDNLNLLEFGGRVFSVDCTDTHIFLGVQVTKKIRTTVITLDAQYNETNRWTIKRNSVDLADIGDKICMTHGMYEKISQYNIASGELVAEIKCDSPPDSVSGCLDNSFVVTNEDKNTVEKIDIVEDSLQRRWVLEGIIKPFSMTVDSQGVTWARSNRYDQITRISKHGEL